MLDNKSVGLDCMTKGRHQPPQQFDKDILDRAVCLSLSHIKARRLSEWRTAGFDVMRRLCAYKVIRACQRKGKDIPIVTLALRLLSGMNSLDTLPKMRSEPMKKL